MGVDSDVFLRPGFLGYFGMATLLFGPVRRHLGDDDDENLHQPQFMDEMKEKGIVRPSLKGLVWTAANIRLSTVCLARVSSYKGEPGRQEV